MNDAEITALLSEIAADVPDRTDDEATAALRVALGRRRRARSLRRGIAGAAAVVALSIAGMVLWPDRGAVDVASEDLPEPTIEVTSDLASYTGTLPPVVVVSTDRREVRLLDAFSLQPDVGAQQPYAKVVTSNEVTAAVAGIGTVFLEFAGPDRVPFMLEVDVATGATLRRWDDASNMAFEGRDGRLAYLRGVGADGDPELVVENGPSDAVETFPVSASGPGPIDSLAWSDDGRLAIGQADGSVRVLRPDDGPSNVNVVTLDGPLYRPDWVGNNTLVGTRDCCGASAVVTLDIESGVVASTGSVGREAVEVGESGSPWGILYIDENDALRGTEGPDVAHVEDVADVRW